MNPTLASLAASLKGEPGVWSINILPIQAAPPGDPANTRHGKGERPPIPSYKNRMLLTLALDTVRLYYLAQELTDPKDAVQKKLLTDTAEMLYNKAQLATVPETELVGHILGHWPLPPPGLWLLHIVNAVDGYLTTKTLLPPYDAPLRAAALSRLQMAVGGIGDGGTGGIQGGHN